MRRILTNSVLIAVTLVLGGCVGDTDPATKIGLRSALTMSCVDGSSSSL